MKTLTIARRAAAQGLNRMLCALALLACIGAQAQPIPTIDVTVNPIPMVAGTTSKVVWTTTNATHLYASCTSEDGSYTGSGPMPLNGSLDLLALDAWVGKTSKCTWIASSTASPYPSFHQHFLTTLGRPPPTINLQVTPLPLIAGKTSTISWNTTLADYVSYTCTPSGAGYAGSGTLPANGSSVLLAQDSWVGNSSHCIFRAVGPTGDSLADVSLYTQGRPVPEISVSVNPLPMIPGQASTITWTSSRADVVSYTCSSADGGYTGSAVMPTTSGVTTLMALSAWSGKTSFCMWSATGPDGTGRADHSLVTLGTAPPQIVVTHTPSPMVVNQTTTFTWQTQGASQVTYNCNAPGAGYNAAATLPSVNGTFGLKGQSAWVGSPSSCVWVASGAGGSTTYTHALHTLAASMPSVTSSGTESATRLSSYQYDPATGLLTAETIEPDNPDLCYRTEYTRDYRGNVTETNRLYCNGASTAATYSLWTRTTKNQWDSYSAVVGGQTLNVASGIFPTRVTNAQNQSEQRRNDPRFGGVLSQTGPNGLTTQWEYDELGRKVLETAPDGNRTVMRYCWLSASGADTSANSAGCTTPTYTPANAVSYVESHGVNASGVQNTPGKRQYSDMLGRVIREETEGYDGAEQPANARIVLKDTDYNEWGAAVKVTQPYFAGTGASVTTVGTAAGWTATDHDALGRPVNVYVRDDEGTGSYAGQTVAQASWSYNGLSVTETRLRTSKNAQGQQQTAVNLSTTRISNAIGQLVQATDGLGGTLRKRYDAFGNVVQVRDAMNNRTLTTYDTRGRKTSLVDPNAGTWQYRYNAAGDLVGQLSPTQGSTWTTMKYDGLGRMNERAEPEYITTWVWGGLGTCANGIGKLCEVTTSHGVTKRYGYDGMGRLISTKQVADWSPGTFETSRTYDANGRLATTTYPSGAVLTHSYTPLGYHRNISRGASALWTLRTVNAWGKAERYETGGSASQTTSELYDPVTGRTTDMRVGDGASQNANILSQTYGWDTVGNLTDRSDRYDATNSVTENFGYDALNRLTSYQTSSAGIAGLSKDVTLAYNAIGNITSKSDVGTYNYPASGTTAARPGAVTSITPAAGQSTKTYSYDAAGNLTASSGGKYSSIAYTSFNLPASLSGAGGSYSWQYGPDHERIKEDRNGRITWYVHPDNQGGLSYEREGTTHRHYVQAQGRTIAMFETVGTDWSETSTNVTKTQWWHSDHLGSVAAITNEANQVTQRFSYDPFGKRRQINGTYDAMGTLVFDHPNSTDRGFTGHEHLDDVGVIHMNGRTYDPHIGRFMQADPVIQEPDNAQNYNRFSYVMNNPLNATDPSGHSFKKIVRIAAAIAIAIAAPQLFMAVGESAAAAVAASSSVSCLAAAGTVFTNYAVVGMFAGGFAAGVVGSGSLEGGITGAVTAGMFHAAGGFGTANSPERYAAHAVAGCANGMMGDNGCGRGAFSAVAGKWGTNASGNNPIAAVVVGGTASVIGGGKFENGATTAAFAYIFNACGNGQCFDFSAKNVEQYYRDGSGKDLTVQMYEIEDLLQDAGVAWSPTNNQNRFVLSTFGRDGVGELSRGRILGDITVERVKDGAFRVLPDYYNFEQHDNPNNNLRTGLRNAITARAGNSVGPGRPFIVRVEGTFRPLNPSVQKLTAPR